MTWTLRARQYAGETLARTTLVCPVRGPVFKPSARKTVQCVPLLALYLVLRFMHQTAQHREDHDPENGVTSMKAKKKGIQSDDHNMANTSASSSSVSSPKDSNDHNHSEVNQQLMLPNEMAGMVPLKFVITKLVHQCYADLHELADT